MRIIPALLMLSLVISYAQPSKALLIPEGDEVTFGFDFSAEALAPPYHAYELHFDYDAKVSPSTSWWTFNIDLHDTSGSYGGTTLSGGADFDTSFALWDNGNPTIILSNTTFQNVTFSVSEGSVDITNVTLAMGINTGTGMFPVNTWTASLNPVPEPTTIILFGTGLAGLAAVSRRRKK